MCCWTYAHIPHTRAYVHENNRIIETIHCFDICLRDLKSLAEGCDLAFSTHIPGNQGNVSFESLHFFYQPQCSFYVPISDPFRLGFLLRRVLWFSALWNCSASVWSGLSKAQEESQKKQIRSHCLRLYQGDALIRSSRRGWEKI